MTAEILIILAAVPLYVINSFCDKYASSIDQNRHSILYNCIKFLLCSVLLLPMYCLDSAPKFTLGAGLCGIICGVMYAVSKTVIMKGYEKTSVAFMTFCHASGMIVPCVLGHFFWNERLSVFSLFGILTVVFSVVLLKNGRSESKGFDIKGVLFGLTVFLTSGGVMIAQKLMGLYFENESVSAYNLYSFAVTFLILLLCGKKEKENKKEFKKIIAPAIGSAVSLSVISVVMTMLAGRVPSVIMFPLFNGLGIIFVCISSVFVFKERLNGKRWVGLLLGVLGLCMINF